MEKPPLRTARIVVIAGYALLAVATGLNEFGSHHNIPEPGAITILRMATLASFAVVGWAWWLHLGCFAGEPNITYRRRQSFGLFSLAALILAIGQISLAWYYASAQLGGFQWASRLSVLTVATGLTAIGYLVVTAGFWLTTRLVSESVHAASPEDMSLTGALPEG
jgi:hypothetical protein